MRKYLWRVAAAVTGAVLAVAGLSAAPATAAKTADCAAYVYTGTTKTLCDKFSGRKDVNCDEVKYKVTLVNKWDDPWKLDGNGSSKGNGYGCESNPNCPVPTKPPTTPPTTAPTTAPTTVPPTTPPTTVPTTPPTTAPTTVPPTTEPTTVPPPTTEPTAAPTTVPATTPPADGDGALPLTGPSAGAVAGGAALLVAVGIGVLLLVRRNRRQTFIA
jgi:hypothetical protein